MVLNVNKIKYPLTKSENKSQRSTSLLTLITIHRIIVESFLFFSLLKVNLFSALESCSLKERNTIFLNYNLKLFPHADKTEIPVTQTTSLDLSSLIRWSEFCN